MSARHIGGLAVATGHRSIPMQIITGGGSLTRQNIIDLNGNFAEAGAPFTPGNLIYCNGIVQRGHAEWQP
jgi:hypothetical protein